MSVKIAGLKTLKNHISWVFPSISLCLSSLTCRSLIKIRHLRAGGFYPTSTGKNRRRQRHSLGLLRKSPS